MSYFGYLQGVNGVKTGFTNNAGRCLVTSVNREGFEIITVILQADTKKIRTRESIELIEYVYQNYELVNIHEIVKKQFEEWYLLNKNRIMINKCMTNKLELGITELENNIIPIKKTDKDNIKIEINNLYYFEAPLEKNTTIGSIKILINNDIIDVIEIKNINKINKKNVVDYLRIFAAKLIR